MIHLYISINNTENKNGESTQAGTSGSTTIDSSLEFPQKTSYNLNPSSVKKILQLLQQEEELLNMPAVVSKAPDTWLATTGTEPILSCKEKEALQLLEKGYSYKMIADKLNKSVETVRVQLKSAYKKMKVHSNTGAIAKMHETGSVR